MSWGRKATDLLKEAAELPDRVGKGPFKPLGKDKKMRFDSKGSYSSASFIDTPVGTQDFVPVALRQVVDKVLTLGICIRFVWPLRSSPTKEVVVLEPSTKNRRYL